ncbi:hypothetical protein HBA54_19245 [Pelagibius litoralis]|uniref:Uncharacterized protein n=1 Tax=Pelagibius litoralis TaxID=374515 RepID=A0A967KC90_9PROT|nr:hypothetical protein [Pelagibius litoralis]NIA70739.1 hypothetical protein [Pelagibius litoralis]
MRIKPILFSEPMVRAILDSRKSQTRRVLKTQPESHLRFSVLHDDVAIFRTHGGMRQDVKVPYAPGDRLWVRETHSIVPKTAYWHDGSIPHQENGDNWAVYREGWERSAPTWKPSIHMTRWASRLTLEVTAVKVERVQDINEADGRAEGVEHFGIGWRAFKGEPPVLHARYAFQDLWNSLNAKRGYGWDVNPWVVAITFKAHHCNIDAMEPQP